jgi:hypothetical protein
MPRLVKGGKWVYGWVIVGPEGELTIPSDAWRDYGFQAGDEAVFLRGSRSSGGFALGTPRLTAELPEAMRGETRVLGKARFSEGRQVRAPPNLSVGRGDRLLMVGGSGRALGFITRGRIYDEAQKHLTVQVFRTAPSRDRSQRDATPRRFSRKRLVSHQA